MKPFEILTTSACALPLASIDTDQLIPARFMKRSRADGYGQYLLHDMRFDESGERRPDFPLNSTSAQAAEILVTRRNFGAGSSREAAVYALVDFGFRCVIAPSFGDIFASNAVNNGLLPAKVSDADAEEILTLLQTTDTAITVDLRDSLIRLGNRTFTFAVDPIWRTKLLNGWDDLDLTASLNGDISRFEQQDAVTRPWVQIQDSD
ncbi:3-isopropylmalate dehydratase small subunit (Isopropylmalate isomerase) (Alpha-IPM isomerase) (IPMI) [Bradyrhizobium sp. ORS 285]|uniref:3-isopropylmalate dehydratase small subunit n=1 Tax=Bradyrhizobium sp. ORS 285 TaxID=115808 RepID=UPI0002406230|nr:3-isopropylmalate dehydratase small subunit [Bradyrhizobium sp. ORS 285]CCD88360.1 3-isopropylmalate dehydratase small subunit (Isopropylmalate isomerase) (Alpha-IPM isomerase) (IPMI) [Bradyrhizobium sp. ORS 285]SMX56891.1 3-isopropylmalate dehydratase small subunit (Isopropylmalate isomerase) (Alpha-IPM isomerase) (IPMI) [Bradyrhizobium sp. ORS 285]